MSTITIGRVVHMSSDDAEAMCIAREGVEEITDECAATIAAWYQSGGPHGMAFAALASGAECDYEALSDAIYREARIARGYQFGYERDISILALGMLGTWALSKIR